MTAPRRTTILLMDTAPVAADFLPNAQVIMDRTTGYFWRLVSDVPTEMGGGQGGSAWGAITGTLADQTDLGSALAEKANTASLASVATSGAYADLTGQPALFDGVYASLSGIPASFTPSAHAHTVGDTAGLQAALDGKSATGHNHDAAYSAIGHNHDAAYAALGHAHAGVYEPANANIQAHVAQTHAPANAQANADITKAEIEAKLTGVIASHSHAGGGGDPFLLKAILAADAATGANVTPISLTGFSFAYEANSRYFIDFAGAVRAAAATTGSGFQLDVSSAVTRVGVTFVHQLANTGTLSGGSSIADDASVGVSSGRPSANVDTPTYGGGYLVTGANAGTAQLRYRSEVAAVSTVMAGFLMRVMKMN